MKAMLTALVAAATLIDATGASPAAGLDDGYVRSAIVGKTTANVRTAYLAAPEPGYIVYSGYAAALPGASCYWTRMPVYDSSHNVIGWRGRPLAVCP